MAKRELESIVQEDMNCCYLCFTTRNLEVHHLIGAANRSNSDKYKLIVRLCKAHHTGSQGVHFNKELMQAFHELAQEKFEERYSREKFVEVFGINYLEGT